MPAQDWISVSDGRVLASPPPNVSGDFTFEVVATDAHGNETKAPLELSVQAAPNPESQIHNYKEVIFNFTDLADDYYSSEPITAEFEVVSWSKRYSMKFFVMSWKSLE